MDINTIRVELVLVCLVVGYINGDFGGNGLRHVHVMYVLYVLISCIQIVVTNSTNANGLSLLRKGDVTGLVYTDSAHIHAR